MQYSYTLTDTDRRLAKRLEAFVPEEIFDIHVHPFNPDHFGPNAWRWLREPVKKRLGCAEHRAEISRYMPSRRIHGLYFGMPHATADRDAINEEVAREVRTNGSALSRALALASPQDKAETIASLLDGGGFCGLKVYHVYSGRPDTMNASIEEFAPEWMWKLLDERGGVLMLHIVRDEAMEDECNQKSLRHLCEKYPRCRLVLAHIARSFNYRHARRGLGILTDLDNVVVDTSAVTESESIRAALEILGSRRVLFGSDFAVDGLKGRCVSTGEHFFWLRPDSVTEANRPPTEVSMTLVGIESLLCLQEACDDLGLNRADVNDIFLNNALRLLRGHLPEAAVPQTESGPQLWKRAREVISCGTGLMSKRAEQFGANHWPSYFSRCSGSEVWGLDGRRYLDFVGGIGAVLLGYADPDVTAAVRRRLSLGSYCTLLNPEEVQLAEELLSLHPWAGKVRYSRGGGDAMAVAVRTARAATGKSGVAFCGYHGWHDWYLAANLGDGTMLDGHLLPGLEPRGVPRELTGTSVPFRYNDLASLYAALDKLEGNLAAVVMEPMRLQMPQDDFLQKAAAACRERGAVFVVDEVTSGLRYGFPGALSRFGIDPDLAVYAKAMSNGFPFGVVVGRDEIMTATDSSFISSSYWTDGVGPAAALAVLRKVQRIQAAEEIWKRGAALQEALRKISAEVPACQWTVGGMPASPKMQFDLGVESPLAQALYVRLMKERGILASGRCYLMLAHREEHRERYLETVREVLGLIGKAIETGRLTEESKGSGLRQSDFARLA